MIIKIDTLFEVHKNKFYIFLEALELKMLTKLLFRSGVVELQKTSKTLIGGGSKI